MEKPQNVVSHTEFDGLVRRLRILEDTSNATVSKLELTRDSLLHVASGFASVSRAKVSLDGGLQRTMKGTADYIINNFARIFDSLTNLNSDVKTLLELAETRQKFDFDGLELRPASTSNWKDAPKLPHLNKFESVENMADFIYELLPKLQGYLIAMHNKIVDSAGKMGEFADKTDTQLNFSAINSDLREIEVQLMELKSRVARAATKNDILNALKKSATAQSSSGETQTAIGTVRCIACGRTMEQVIGALTEEQADKLMGAPPNCVAAGAPTGTPYSPMYTGVAAESFDSAGMMESPRSVRPFRASAVSRRKIQIPMAPK
jgi:hypothetical protein